MRAGAGERRRRRRSGAGKLIAQAPRAQDVGESKERAERQLHGLPPAERHAGPRRPLPSGWSDAPTPKPMPPPIAP